MIKLNEWAWFCCPAYLRALLLIVICMAYVPLNANASSLILVSQEGDPIGNGLTFGSTEVDAAYFIPINDGITVENEDFYVSVRAEIEGETWFIRFAAPDGQMLVPGTYEDADSFTGGSTLPGLSFFRSGSDVFCLWGTGRFEVSEAKYRAHGYVERFSASFEFHCEGSREPAIFGEVEVANPVPPPPPRIKLRFDERGVIMENGMARVTGSITCSTATTAEVVLVLRQLLPAGQMIGSDHFDIYVPDCSPTESRFNAAMVGYYVPFQTGHARVLAKAKVVDPVYQNMIIYRKESVRLVGARK